MDDELERILPTRATVLPFYLPEGTDDDYENSQSRQPMALLKF
jgi:hypothetical protein